MKIRITKKGLKKYQLAGETTSNCGPGFVDDGYGNCIPEEPQKFSAVPALSGAAPAASTIPSLPSYFPMVNLNPFDTGTYDLTQDKDGMINSTRGFVTQQDTEQLDKMPSYNQRIDQLSELMKTGSKKQIKQGINSFNTDFGTDMKGPGMFTMGAKGRKGVGKAADTFNKIGDGIKIGALAGNMIVDAINRPKKEQEFKQYLRGMLNSDGLYNPVAGSDGDYVVTGSRRGELRPNQYVVNRGMFAEYGGENPETMKIRITGLPSMAYGGQSNYGLDLGRKKVYTDMPESKADTVTNTMSGVPRELANIEAEGGETVYGDLDNDGMLEHMKIQGKRHSQGGVPLNVPQGSFIFSDTKKMKIKDPAILQQFGLSYKKGGITPAEIAKKYPINKYKAVLQDPNADELDKSTAQHNYNNAQDKLGLLSVVQESMKNFPQGLPEVATSMMGLGEAAYGGYMMPRFQVGGPKTKSKLGEWSDDYEKLSTLLQDDKNKGLRKAMFEEYLKDYPTSPLKNDAEGEKKFIQNFLNAQEQFMGIRSNFKDKPEMLTSEDWDRGGVNAKYNKIAKELGYTPMNETDIKRFQGGYRALLRALKNDKDKTFNESFGKFFDLTPIGVKDEEFMGYPVSKDDGWVGNTTLGQTSRLRDEKPATPAAVPGYICKGINPETGFPIIDTASYPDEAARQAAGAYASKTEASLNCGESPFKPGTIDQTTSDKSKAKYWTPDLINLGIAAMNPPKKYMPYRAPINLAEVSPTFYDPNRQIAALNEQANIFSQNMGMIGDPRAYIANMSKLQGNLAENVANTIGDYQNRNVQVANQFAGINADTVNKENMLNMQRTNDLYDASIIGSQNFDNAQRKFYNNLGRSYGNAFGNRMYGDMLNKVNQIYNVDPQSGLSFFKEGYRPSMLGQRSSSGSADWTEISKAYRDAKLKFGNDLSFSDFMKVSSPKTTYSDTDQDGFANRTNFTGYNLPQMYASMLALAGRRNLGFGQDDITP